MKILVVDDDLMLRQFMSDLFSRDYSVVLAADGKEGLIEVRRENPDLVISDFHMPRMTGLEFINALRAAGDTRPVIVCAAGVDEDTVDEDTVAEILSGGAAAFVNKGGRDAVKNLVETVQKLGREMRSG